MARKKEAIAYFSIESAAALLISLFINLCVVSVFAKGFYGKGASDIGLINAGTYLGDRFGQHMVTALLSLVQCSDNTCTTGALHTTAIYNIILCDRCSACTGKSGM